MDRYWTVYFDGACAPNRRGGQLWANVARCGWLVQTPDGITVERGCKTICRGPGATNNVAEYHGLIEALKYLKKAGIQASRLRCYGDSRLVVNQVTGRCRCRKLHLEVLRQQVRDLLTEVSIDHELIWIPRWQNTEADCLSHSKSVL